MSYFKNFSKTLCSSRLTRPNNIILASQTGPAVLLVRENEPSVDHINSLKALHNTINKLSQHTSGNYSKLVEEELRYLNRAAEDYAQNCKKYVENGGCLTAQGLANVYACGEKLGINSDWLTAHVYG